MIINAKYAASCACCKIAIVVGSKIEWSKGKSAVHEACAGKPAAASAPRPRGPGRATGCGCGSREYADGSISATACAQCQFDA